MVVVGAIARIEIEDPPSVDKRPIRDDRPVIALDHGLVVAAQDIDMGRHVMEMACIGYEAMKGIGRLESPFRMGRHLHHMDMHVKDPGMPPGAFDPVEGGLENLDGFHRIRSFRRPGGFEIPELPARAVHQRIGIERTDIRMPGVSAIDTPHGRGIGIVPCVPVVALVERKAFDQSSAETFFEFRCTGRAPHGFPALFAGALHAHHAFLFTEIHPQLVVVGTGREGDTPVGHRTAGIVFERLLETVESLFMVEPVAPGETTVEPGPGFPGGCRDRAVKPTEIEIVVHCSSVQCCMRDSR